MLEPVRETRLAFEVREEEVRHRARVRHLERDLDAVDRVDGGVDGRHRSVRNPLVDAVLAEFLSRLEQAEKPPEIFSGAGAIRRFSSQPEAMIRRRNPTVNRICVANRRNLAC